MITKYIIYTLKKQLLIRTTLLPTFLLGVDLFLQLKVCQWYLTSTKDFHGSWLDIFAIIRYFLDNFVKVPCTQIKIGLQ